MKKIRSILLLLVSVQLFSFSARDSNPDSKTLNSNKIGIKNSVKLLGKASFVSTTSFAIEDLEGNKFILEEGKSGGYAIYDSISGVFIEKSDDGLNPFKEYSNEVCIYLGPMNYFIRKGESFYSIYDDLTISYKYVEEVQKIFSSQLTQARNQIDTAFSKTSNLDLMITNNTNAERSYIPYSQYVSTTEHSENTKGNCGFVAASLILNWWDQSQKWCIPSKYRESNGNLVRKTRSHDNKYDLAEHLVYLNGGDNSSWALPVRDTLIKYCEEVNVSASSSYYIGKIGLMGEINSGKPAILFGALPSLNEEGKKITHAVAVYGTENHWWGKNFIVNYGWNSSSSNCVVLNAGWAGSVTTFKLT